MSNIVVKLKKNRFQISAVLKICRAKNEDDDNAGGILTLLAKYEAAAL